ncbi:glycine decarboxylase (subunit 1) (glycine cleavage system protein P) [[Clostridium] ultunense Esp]|uniref:Probable glycine dehydrogenase (decarboxylating) subunit 1 n=1 Tax=[Clostridium] ultunense Esp TaxID=1288971 RepID=M1ZHZ0_9FIRM|nr:aminomethyl-transferring glycine dehydrogenase subunit GcvPA [Schnuerera ultunensis]CCQ93522.1 glycine decarboxylase (subunit 1) (glycine cleavage system protein P) [[Clostridium] ultunense Esp]SHD75461.1 glycine decarboxylase (subunit 1) (glycine cleavage system protein P) [[Clostridium] ultunense Esp]
MYPYIPNTKDDEKRMLEYIGFDSMEDLFSDIPENVKLKRELDLKPSMSELEVSRYLIELSRQNISTNQLTCFLGAGAYDHYIPSIVGHITSRSEFYTSYTPYQAEISQGTLQYIFEYQTLIANLTGMDVSNASLYDGGTAVAEAAFMAANITRRDQILVSKTVNPESREVLKTYAHLQGIEVIEIEGEDGVTNTDQLREQLSDKTAAVIVQSPNFFGVIEDLEGIGEIVHSQKRTLFITSVDPISLGILKSPGSLGADIVVGEGQPLGIPLQFGGPYLGFIAVNKAHMRKLPGRIVGETVDEDGNRAFVLTLQAREQHIRREKATSNICSNQGINTLAAAVYLTTLGKKGLRELALQATQKAHYAFNQITKSGKFKPLFDKPFFKEFAVTSDIEVDQINKGLLDENILGGYPLEKDYPQYKNGVLYAVTEKRTKEEIDKLSSVLEGIK